ncbi:hypothetical protein NDU88_001155 [Pleurodeles waltl]|uniref:Secreted protein n=1 Tax=Pleurodeles waltl TaxID=8319 RepID=A0AAV7NDY8_PLEWA|nr:hypothetical protein NDU88_001155 [Pleurodeles waltl]
MRPQKNRRLSCSCAVTLRVAIVRVTHAQIWLVARSYPQASASEPFLHTLLLQRACAVARTGTAELRGDGKNHLSYVRKGRLFVERVLRFPARCLRLGALYDTHLPSVRRGIGGLTLSALLVVRIG